MSSPVEVSDSQFKTFQGCQRKWSYNKLLKLDPLEDKDAMHLGNAWHDGAETYIKTRSIEQAINAALTDLNKTKPTAIEYQKLLVPAMLIGWASLWLPAFELEYEYIALEEWFDIKPNPDVMRLRGFKDVVALKRTTRKRCVFDYKTSSQAYARDLIATLSSNNQLARYATAERREKGEFPAEVGLIFAYKPKSENVMKAIEQARSDPSMYKTYVQQVTPQFATFALEVERNDILMSQQMQFYRDQVAARGPSACDDIPADFNNCFQFGKMCGFSTGCHSGNPAHRCLKKAG